MILLLLLLTLLTLLTSSSSPQPASVCPPPPPPVLGYYIERQREECFYTNDYNNDYLAKLTSRPLEFTRHRLSRSNKSINSKTGDVVRLIADINAQN